METQLESRGWVVYWTDGKVGEAGVGNIHSGTVITEWADEARKANKVTEMRRAHRWHGHEADWL